MIDVVIGVVLVSASAYVIYNFEKIMTTLPWAKWYDVLLATGAVLSVLELARRATGSIFFPSIVMLSIAYALFGNLIPGEFGHRGFDIYYLTEVVFLSDRGLWGLLVSVASTTLAAFVLFGAMLLHTGAGQTFFDLSARAGGNSPGGAAKIATIASGLFGSINGSTVANVATTGNFTIPLMARLGYPRSFAGGVEAVASTGGQLAPPIMGTAAFVMAELVDINYWQIAVAAILPAFLFYLAVFATVHHVAKRKHLGRVDTSDLPDWRQALDWRRLAPIVAAVLGLGLGILQGRSIALTACYGMIGMMGTAVAVVLLSGDGLRAAGSMVWRALIDGGRGVVTVGVLLVAAQVFVGVLNLTGFGVAATSAILQSAGQETFLVAAIMAIVCLIAGMGLPTSAAYVLVAAVFAPALIQQGLDPLTVHFFVLYYATLSVITPPVCVGVFVAATIAGSRWIDVAGQSLRLAATVYVLPMLFLIYPGMLAQGGAGAIALAAATGIVFCLSAANFLALRPVFGGLAPSTALWLLPAASALFPNWGATATGVALFLGLELIARRAGRDLPSPPVRA
ncbi:TRAP transporter permease [Amorphus orientalis]|uniref:TRAP transporter 4TM/12TM fusion protein n=1 Tax=Amorphus orientalis TaxID=649198 RepID=A0AAE3VSV4_9HYPH|nr:TRAP transporter fused permease subunit [Amorphus orientalis]MDQ0317506.1 TRAP transporter 4TM/12TM fusion protein [Amorphus orientalis]